MRNEFKPTPFVTKRVMNRMVLGYETCSQTIQLPVSAKLTIKMKPTHLAIDEVEVVASSYQLKGNSQWSKMNAVDLVTTGGSNGDLYKSIETLLGAQMVGDGKLYIRGGESREAQTYIDDMHVLVPYTTTGENDPVCGRYLSFMLLFNQFSMCLFFVYFSESKQYTDSSCLYSKKTSQ